MEPEPDGRGSQQLVRLRLKLNLLVAGLRLESMSQDQGRKFEANLAEATYSLSLVLIVTDPITV